jgi:hypothetical protein
MTVQAMVAVPLTALSASAYLFCSDPDCPSVYYSDDGAQVFAEVDLRERVYHKHPADDDVFICYCFRHTVGAI